MFLLSVSRLSSHLHLSSHICLSSSLSLFSSLFSHLLSFSHWRCCWYSRNRFECPHGGARSRGGERGAEGRGEEEERQKKSRAPETRRQLQLDPAQKKFDTTTQHIYAYTFSNTNKFTNTYTYTTAIVTFHICSRERGRKTRGIQRGAGTHGDVLNPHTERKEEREARRESSQVPLT